MYPVYQPAVQRVAKSLKQFYSQVFLLDIDNDIPTQQDLKANDFICDIDLLYKEEKITKQELSQVATVSITNDNHNNNNSGNGSDNDIDTEDKNNNGKIVIDNNNSNSSNNNGENNNNINNKVVNDDKDKEYYYCPSPNSSCGDEYESNSNGSSVSDVENQLSPHQASPIFGTAIDCSPISSDSDTLDSPDSEHSHDSSDSQESSVWV